MPKPQEVRRVTFNDLPKIGEAPLAADDLLAIIGWAVSRKQEGKRFAVAAAASLSSLESACVPQDLSHSGDEPLRSGLTKTAHHQARYFGLKTAQSITYSQLYQRAVGHLNNDLLSHFQSHGVTLSVHDLDMGRESDGSGIFESVRPDMKPQGLRVEDASGGIVNVRVEDASVWLRGDEGYCAARFVSTAPGSSHLSEPNPALALELEYPGVPAVVALP